MEQITKWRDNKNKISQHNIVIGAYNEQIGQIKELIGAEKEKISICDNINRETPYYWVFQWIKNNLPAYEKSFEDSVSQGQFESKLWMHEELSKIYLNDVHVDIIGSWFAFPMIEFLIDLYDVKQIDLYDKDTNCHSVVAQYINHFDLDIKIAQFGDIFERKDYRRRQLIINTACEHMNDMSELKSTYKDYPEKPILVLQSNNYFGLPEHVNCVKDEDELVEKNHIKEILYKGKQSQKLYDRFMVIGKW